MWIVVSDASFTYIHNSPSYNICFYSRQETGHRKAGRLAATPSVRSAFTIYSPGNLEQSIGAIGVGTTLV
jgi:hypothetical protein